MKNILLLLAIGLTAHLSFGQDRSDGLVRLKSHRNVIVNVHRDRVMIIKTDANRNVYQHIMADGNMWRLTGRGAYSRSMMYTHYYRATNRFILKRELQQVRFAVRNAIRSAIRFGRN